MILRSSITRTTTHGVACRLLSALVVLTAGCPLVALAATGQLEITVVDRETGRPIACRMHLKSANGRPRKAGRMPFWHDHFVIPGSVTLRLPLGNYTFDIERGPEYTARSGYFTINNFADDTKQVDLGRFVDMSAHGWWSGDLHIRRRLPDVELLMAAEDLHVGQVVTWQNDETDWGSRPLPQDPLVHFDDNRYYHTMAGRHVRAGTTLSYFNLAAPLRLDATAGDEYPPSMSYLLQARKNLRLWVDVGTPFSWDLPMLVALGQVDSIQLAHDHLRRDSVTDHEADGKARDKSLYPPPSGNARWSQEIYFRLLDCGLKIPPTAGSGSGVAPNPVGYNRMYVHVDGDFTYPEWWENLRLGRVVVTNGPLLRPSVNGRLPGHVFTIEGDQSREFEIGLTLSTRQPISYLEIIKNGKVEHSIPFDIYAKSGRLPKLQFERSGWFLVRAVADLPKTYRFAMTGPYYVEKEYRPRISRQAAQFFLDWVYERARGLELTDPDQRREVLEYHRKARDFWQKKLSEANAE
ncbi:MAG: hypothetical protein V3R99_08135 [Thermoguttaceae bacterium]